MNVQGKKSIQELKRRTSNASMKFLSRPSSPIPDVPKIPSAFHDQRNDLLTPIATTRTPTRFNKLVIPSAQSSTPCSPTKSSIAAPKTPTGPKQGLRGLYRGNRTIERPRLSSSFQSPTSSKHSNQSDPISPILPSVLAPQRISSRNAPTSSGQAQNLRAPTSEELLVLDPTPSECSIPPPPTVDAEDLISEADPREKWWKDVHRVYPHSSSKISGPSTISPR